MLFVGPGKTVDGRKVGPKLILSEIRTDEPGRGINARVSVHRCNKSFNLHHEATPARFLPWALSNCILNKYSGLPPSFQQTAKYVTTELDTYRVSPCEVAKLRLMRGLGGTIVVQYLTYCENLASSNTLVGTRRGLTPV